MVKKFKNKGSLAQDVENRHFAIVFAENCNGFSLSADRSSFSQTTFIFFMPKLAYGERYATF